MHIPAVKQQNAKHVTSKRPFPNKLIGQRYIFFQLQLVVDKYQYEQPLLHIPSSILL